MPGTSASTPDPSLVDHEVDIASSALTACDMNSTPLTAETAFKLVDGDERSATAATPAHEFGPPPWSQLTCVVDLGYIAQLDVIRVNFGRYFAPSGLYDNDCQRTGNLSYGLYVSDDAVTWQRISGQEPPTRREDVPLTSALSNSVVVAPVAAAMEYVKLRIDVCAGEAGAFSLDAFQDLSHVIPAGPDPLAPSADPVTDADRLGYQGPDYDPRAVSGAVAVLAGTVGTASSGSTWTATGLVRNETGADVGSVTVRASLTGAGGVDLGTLTATVPVDPLRAGEPAPFRISGTVAAPVTAATYTVAWQAPAAQKTRDYGIATLWTLDYGTRETSTGYPFTDGACPCPYVAFGNLTNQSSASASAPAVVAAWMSPSGQIEHVTGPISITDPDGVVPSLDSGASGDFVLPVADAVLGPIATNDELLLWAVTR